MKDLFILAADTDIEATMRGLLTRRQLSLGIRSIEFTIVRHLRRDPGCRRQAAMTARRYVNNHEYALVLFDKDGSGDEGSDRQEIQIAVENDLRRAGWENKSKVIVIEPELECGCGPSLRTSARFSDGMKGPALCANGFASTAFGPRTKPSRQIRNWLWSAR